MRAALAAAARHRRLAAGQWVYGEGDETTGLVLILHGLLRLEASVGARHNVLVGVARAGSALGQAQRQGGGPRIVTARAGPASEVVTIADAALDHIGATVPQLWRAVSERVYVQLDASVHGLAQMLALPPRARIAARLLPFADDGVAPLAQADLAEMCGLSRKATHAHLIAIEAAGAIRRGYGAVHIRDASRLAWIAEAGGQ